MLFQGSLLTDFSDKDIEELIIFDSKYIPFTGTIKKYLLNMGKDQAEKFLNRIQDKIIVDPEYHLAYSHGNLIKYMDCLENFDLFIKKDRISTLDTCESLLSWKALNLELECRSFRFQ